MARHGESDYSVAGLLNGDPRIACGLTALGLAQARRLGYELEGVPLDLCLTSEFERTRLTATEALAGRGIPSLVVPGFNDPRYGRYEGAALEEYRAWAASAPSSEPAPGGGRAGTGSSSATAAPWLSWPSCLRPRSCSSRIRFRSPGRSLPGMAPLRGRGQRSSSTRLPCASGARSSSAASRC